MSSLRDLVAINLILFLVLGVMPPVLAQDHVVDEGLFRDELVEASMERERNVKRVGEFFSSPQVARILGKLDCLGLEKISEVVPSLTDQELAYFSNQIGELDEEVEAGELTNQQLTYIVIALATAVIVLIIVR